MALLNSYDSKTRKPLMLKDYLLDDLSSCSSNGFRSFPRRQCCTTVRFLLENDLRTRDSSNRRRSLLRSKSTNTSSAKSVFQRASEAVIAAVKLLPFAAVKSQDSSNRSKPKSFMLPRSLSRKILKRSFWTRTDKEIERRTFKYLLEERETPSPPSPPFPPPDSSPSAVNTTTTSTNSNSNSWSEGEFTSDYLLHSSGNSERSIENDVVERERRLPEKAVSKRIGVTVGDDSIEATTTNSKNKWPIAEEKEQFSPVSVLDVPCEDDDEDDEVSSPFTRRLSRMEGTKQKLIQKIRRFKNLAQLEPLDLEKSFSLPEFTDESWESPSPSPSQLCSDTSQEEKDINTKHTAVDLLELIKPTFPSSSVESNSENLLLDFFLDRVSEGNEKLDYERVLNEARDWVHGPARDVFLGWEEKKNREAYVRDMEEGGRWRKVDEAREEVALEVEVEVFASLVDEILLDLISSHPRS